MVNKISINSLQCLLKFSPKFHYSKNCSACLFRELMSNCIFKLKLTIITLSEMKKMKIFGFLFFGDLTTQRAQIIHLPFVQFELFCTGI